jgi:hypothetical protein
MNADKQVSVEYATSNGTAGAGTNYVATSGTLTFAPGQFYSQIVVPILGGDSPSAGGTFSIELYWPAQASIGPVSTIQVSIEGVPSAPDPPPVVAGSPITQSPIGTAPSEVGITELLQPLTVGGTHQARRTGTRLAGFQLTFNEALDPVSAGDRSNYTVLDYHRVGRRIVAQSIRLRASYEPSVDTVSLVMIGEHLFRLGGSLALNASRLTGITDPARALLDGNMMFTIPPRTNGIMP